MTSPALTKTQPGRLIGVQRWLALPVSPVMSAAAVAFVVLVCLLQPAQPFAYDAGDYWRGAVALVGGGDFEAAGALNMRGILTTLIYAPSAVAVSLIGDGWTLAAVAIQNGLVLALMGVGVLPRLFARRSSSVTQGAVWASTLLVTGLLSRFAVVPMMDFWACAFCLLAFYALRSTRRTALLLAGLSIGLAVALRPIYLIVLLGLIPLVITRVRARVLWILAGCALAFVPQVIFNLSKGVLALAPSGAGAITDIQAKTAPFVIRYDTSPLSSTPRWWSCNDVMAAATSSGPSPRSTIDILLSNPLETVVLIVQKQAGALQWPWSLPFYDSTWLNWLTGVGTTVVLVYGLWALVLAWRESGRSARYVIGGGLVVVAATSLAMAGSTPEARFALPQVMVAIAATVSLGRRPSARQAIMLSVAITLFVAIGQMSVGHPTETAAGVPPICTGPPIATTAEP